MSTRSTMFGWLLIVSGSVAFLVIILGIYAHFLVRQFPSNDGWLIVAPFTGAVLVLILAAGAIQIRLIVRSFSSVLKGMAEVQRGKYPLLVAAGNDEIAALSRGFNRMVEELRAREERLQSWAGNAQSEVSKLSAIVEEEREKLEQVLDRVGEGVIVLDEENKVLMANSRVAEVLGLPPGSIMGADFEKLMQQLRYRLVEPDTIAGRVRDMKSGDGEGISLELDSPGGQEIRLFSAPVRGSGGKVLARFATFLDLRKERELERLKTEFLSTISHELRTPLTSVKGSLGLIRAGAAGPVSADMRELLDIASANVERLVGVISNILDISNLERGKSSFRMAPTAIGEVADKAVQSVASDAEERHVSIENHLAPELPQVTADARRIEQVFMNLLSNAIKFSPANSKVQIEGKVEGANLVLSVHDFGKGIAPEFMGRLFGKFEHSEEYLTRSSQGVGLGLAISRNIVEAHGGRIWAESEPGKQTAFYFTLPVAQAAQPGLGNAQAPAAGRAQGKFILVIDDDEDVTRVMSRAIESMGHRVIVAHEGRDALDLIRKHHPDLVTLDLNIPDLDGYGVLQALRSAADTKDLPVICISVELDTGRALSLGADCYIEKPVDMKVLRETVDRLLSRTRACWA